MKIGFIFPGQGSQRVGMGKEIYDKSALIREVYAQANEILGYDLKKLCFEGQEKELMETKNSQPAILVTSIAYLKIIAERPSAVAGLSLGEYTALICAGSLGFAQGLKIVQQRAQFMQEASSLVEAGMASIVGLSEDEVRQIIKAQGNTVDVANLNCPGQVVISGLKEEIDKLIPIFDSAGARKVIPLNVSGPFHSRYMESARIKLEPFLKEAEIKKPAAPFFANVTGTQISEPEEIKECLIRQVTASVYWERSIKNMMALGMDSFNEVGPGNVLSGLLRRINKEAKVVN